MTNSQNIPNYLVQAILTTLFCCLPFGVIAIIYAAQVNSHAEAGNREAALKASKNAKLWCWVSFGTGAGFALLYFVFILLAVLLPSLTGN